MNQPKKTSGGALSPWKWVLLAWMAAVICMAYLWAQDLAQFQNPPSARIIFWHVPMAELGLVWFGVAAWYAGRYLLGKGEGQFEDTRASKAAEIGLLLTILATVTGAIFSKMQWAGGFNSPWYVGYWQWDPKQTSIVIDILIFMAYFGLRMSVDDPKSRARFSAVYAILGFAAVPFLYWVLPNLPVFNPSLHPGALIIKQGGLDTPYRVTLYMSTFGFLGISIWGYQLKLRLARLEERILSKMEPKVSGRTEAIRKPVTEQ